MSENEQGVNERVIRYLVENLTQVKGRLAALESKFDTAVYIVILGFLMSIVAGVALGYYISLNELESVKEAYTTGYAKGYRQGITDALKNPEDALAELLCAGDYSATVTIDGREFTLICQEKG